MSNKNDLLNSLLSGDSKGILEIYNSVFPSVSKYISINNGTQEDAEDIFQKSLLLISAKVKVKNYQPIKNFEWYLFGICKNLWLKELKFRKKWVTKPINEELYSESSSKLSALTILDNDRWELYMRNFDFLSDNCKKVLSLFLMKKPYSEIAKTLGYNSESVVRQRVFKCKSKLTKTIQKDPSYKKLKNL